MYHLRKEKELEDEIKLYSVKGKKSPGFKRSGTLRLFDEKERTKNYRKKKDIEIITNDKKDDFTLINKSDDGLRFHDFEKTD